MLDMHIRNRLNHFFESIQHGLICTIPILYISSFIVFFLSISWTPFQEFLQTSPGQGLSYVLNLAHQGTYMVLSPIVLISSSYNIIAKDYYITKENINPIIPVIIVFGCYYVLLPSGGLEVIKQYAGATGLFFAMIYGVFLSKGLIWLLKHQIFKFKVVANDKDWAINNTLRFIEPAAFLYTISAFLVFLYHKLSLLCVVTTVKDTLIDGFFRETTKFLGVLAYEFITHMLWFLGIHGTNFAENYTQNTFSAASAINIGLYGAGQPPTEIFTKQFFDSFVFIGGAGATLCLIIAIFVAKSEMRRFSSIKFSIFFGLFNINEIIIYGLPVVFNPYFIIPFILTPVILTLVTYAAMAAGFVPLTVSDVFWSTPVFFSGYAATNSIRGILMQAVNLAVGTAVYFPFVKAFARKKEEDNISAAKNLLKDVAYVTDGSSQRLLQRSDELGYLLRSLAEDLRLSLNKGDNPLHMVFQPTVNSKGAVIGGEALLRWNHKTYGYINPETVVTIASEAGLIDKLGEFTIDYVFKTLSQWNRNGLKDICISLNIAPQQLKNSGMVKYIRSAIAAYGIDPEWIELEITENSTIDNSDATKALLDEINNMGMKLAIDDFGMGHSSLLYISKFNVKTVKIDGALVKDIDKQGSSYEIVSSICNLCHMLHLNVIAEYVETKAHVELLCELGCYTFQGYYFSKPLSAGEFFQFAKEAGEQVLR